MGSALLAQWAAPGNGDLSAHHFHVIDPLADSSMSTDRVSFMTQPPPVEQCNFDLVIVAVKPQVVNAVLPDYVPRLADGGFVASIAAGCSIDRLSKLAGGAPVVRIMPNLPAAIGQGVSGLCAGPDVSQVQRGVIEDLMKAAGKALWVDSEDKLDRLTAVAGSGPGYVFEIARTYVEAAQSLGFTLEEARELVLGTMAGTIAMAMGSDQGLEDLRNSVTSKAGTTAAGLDALNADDGLTRRLRNTVDAAYARAVELR